MSAGRDDLLTPREQAALDNHPEVQFVSRSQNRGNVGGPSHRDDTKYWGWFSSDVDAESRRDLVGVKGWLAFLAILLVVLGPIAKLYLTAADLNATEFQYPGIVDDPAWDVIGTLSWVSAALSVMVSVFAGYCLFSRHMPPTVPIVIACLWISGPGISTGTALIVPLLTLDRFRSPELSAVLTNPLIYAIFWTAYLIFSRRVKNTYRRGENLRMTDVFK